METVGLFKLLVRDFGEGSVKVVTGLKVRQTGDIRGAKLLFSKEDIYRKYVSKWLNSP